MRCYARAIQGPKKREGDPKMRCYARATTKQGGRPQEAKWWGDPKCYARATTRDRPYHGRYWLEPGLVLRWNQGIRIVMHVLR